MHISDEQLDEFIKLYKNRFGEDITRVEALEKGTKLIRLLKLVYKPIKKSDITNID